MRKLITYLMAAFFLFSISSCIIVEKGNNGKHKGQTKVHKDNGKHKGHKK
jgi:hypothetical protein